MRRVPNINRSAKSSTGEALEALRSLTAPGEFVWALDNEGQSCRFWPHEVDPGVPWPFRTPGPYAYDSSFVPCDLSWRLYVDWHGVTVQGQLLISAFEQHEPSLFSRAAEVHRKARPRFAPVQQAKLTSARRRARRQAADTDEA